MDRIPSKLDFLRGLLKGMELNGSKKNVIIEEIIEILELLYEEINFCREDCEREELEVEDAAGEEFQQADDFEDKTMKRTDFKTPAGMADVWFDESLTVAKRPEKPAGAGTSVPVYNAKTVMEKICKHCGTYIRAEFSFDESKRVKIQCPKCKHFILPEDGSSYESLKEHAFNWDDLEERKESGFVFEEEDDFDEMDDVASIIQEAHSFSVDVSEVEQFHFSGADEEDGLSFEELHGIDVETPIEEDEELSQADFEEQVPEAEEDLEVDEEDARLLCAEEDLTVHHEPESDIESELALEQAEQSSDSDASVYATAEAPNRETQSEQTAEFSAQRPYYGPQGQAPYYPSEYPHGPEFYAGPKADPYRTYPRPDQVFYPPYPYVDPYQFSMQRVPVGYYPPQANPYQNDFSTFAQHGMSPQQAPYQAPFPGAEQAYASKFQQERPTQVNPHRDSFEQVQAGGAESRYEDFASKEALFHRPLGKKSMYQEEQIAESEEPESDLSPDYENEFQSIRPDEKFDDMPLANEGLYDFGTEIAEQAEHVVGTDIEGFKLFENNYDSQFDAVSEKNSVVEFNRGGVEEDLQEEAETEMDDEEFFRRQFENDDLLEEETDLYGIEEASEAELASDEELNHAYEILKPELSPVDEMGVYQQEREGYSVNEEADRMEDGILFGEFEMEAPQFEEDKEEELGSYYEEAASEGEEAYFQAHGDASVAEREEIKHDSLQAIDAASIFRDFETVTEAKMKQDMGMNRPAEGVKPVNRAQANPTYNPLGKFEGNKMANIGDVIDSITEAYNRKKSGASNPAPHEQIGAMQQASQREVGKQKSIPVDAKQNHDKKSKKDNGKIFGRMFKKS